ncbi:class I SAM-dependent methyltransferase [Paenibacillus sp. HJGM_3]|uniref:class I SAM-dependent methyltransferase n=1 Tax=Paenibacillus sp. HJGM_3 TaxID=3379816 RepID=UPI00385E2D63
MLMSITARVQELCQEKLLFLRQFLRHPGQIGSVTPSSSYLARAMANAIPWERVSSVAELGAGTGPITSVLRDRLRPGAKLVLFEKEPLLRRELESRFPELACYPDVLQLYDAIRKEGIVQADCIVSGLPFANFPRSLRDRILHQLDLSLKPGGTFVAFQYSLQMREQFERMFELRAIRFVPLNVPPAFVYVCVKK